MAMSENEAIKVFNQPTKHIKKFMLDGEETICYSTDMVKALEEIKAYRAIGTVEEITNLIKFLSFDDDTSILEDLRMLVEYYAIGTIEECRVAVERMKPKKVADDGAFGRCPVCDYEFNSELRDEYNISVCLGCFQVLDWSN